MASGGQRINNVASQPSAAFLLKCAKEKEKLRLRLQKQLQKHMLSALRDATFVDLSIEAIGRSGEKGTSPRSSPDGQIPTLVSCHCGILQARVPNFYEELLKTSVGKKSGTTVYSSLNKADLETFLRKVYTDDDIRKHECDALRLQKKESQGGETVESPESNLGETLELNQKNLERHCAEHEIYDRNILGEKNRDGNDNSRSVTKSESLLNSLGKSESLLEKGEESGDSLELSSKNKRIPNNLEIYNVYESEKINNTEDNNMNMSPIQKLQHQSDLLSPALSEAERPDDTPSPLSTSSLVRSSTFDLQCPLALEKVLDADEEATNSGESGESKERIGESERSSAFNESSQQRVSNYKEMMLNTTREIQQCISGQPHLDSPIQSFYLHQRQHVNEHPIHPCSTSDASLADSGFLSQSLFSDTDVVSSSLPSSLVNSFEGCHSENLETNNLENDQYIEPPTYFEVPVKNAIDGNGNIPPVETYGTGMSKTMDLIAELPSVNESRTKMTRSQLEEGYENAVKRPQSCYMFIDLDTVAKEEEELASAKRKRQEQRSQNKQIQSLSMFIDFTKDNKDVVSQAQKQYKQFASNRSASAAGPRELRKADYDGNPPDLVQKNNNGENVPGYQRNRSSNCNDQRDVAEESETLDEKEINHDAENKNVVVPITVFENEFSKSRGKSAPTTKSEKSKLNDEPIKSSPRKDKSMKSGGIDEDGLLPMSPIMRRKIVKPEKPKIEPEKVQVKASTKPQDIDAMTFRHSLTDADVLNSGEEILVLIQDKTNSSLSLVPAVSSSQDNSFTMTFYDSEAKLDQPPEEVNSASPARSDSPEREPNQNQTEVKTIGWSDSLERPASKSHLASSFEGDDDTETVYSEVSDVSSAVLRAIGGSGNAISTQGQSPEEGREAYSGAYGSIRIRALEACSKLGEDLLRMFLEEISWDIIVQVDGREIKAHKCILVSRCKYFATMLNGDWSEGSGNTINLQGFSYPVVHFALCHIYSGAINLPKDLAVPELALLADMLVLDTLKDVIVFYLKMNHCHFFHKPCNHCLVGVVECLPVAVQCSLKELRGKAMRWIGKHFIRVWPTKAFASLSDDLKEQCYQQTLLNMSVETVIDMSLNCDRLMSTVPHVKWAEPVFGLVTRLLEDCIHFMAGKFDQVLASDGFMALGKSQSWNVAALEDSVLSSVELVNPDSACRTFIQLNRLIPMTQGTESGLLHSSNISPIDHGEWTQNFLDLLLRIQRHCERYLIHNANKVVHCQSWALLAPEVQKKIKDAAVIVFEFEKPTAPPPRLTSLQRKQKNPEDKSLTFPRKAQVVRGKKTSKSFRERPTEGKETEVKRPLPPSEGVKAASRSNLSLQESVGASIPLDKDSTPIARISRRRASEGYYKIDHLQRSYEEDEDDDDEDNDSVIVSEQSRSGVDDPLQDDLPPPPDDESGCLAPDEEFPSPPNEEQMSEEISSVDHPGSDACAESRVSFSVSSNPSVSRVAEINTGIAIEPPAKPPRRSIILDSGYDILKDVKPVPVKEVSRSPKRDPPLPPNPNPPSSIPVTTASSSQHHIYSKPIKGIPKSVAQIKPPPITYQDSAPPETAAADLDEDDDSFGYEKVWVGVTGAPYHFDEQISPASSSRTDLVAEIDEETTLVNTCLHEAEALELAIAKKMATKQRKFEKMINTSTYSVSHSHHHHSSPSESSDLPGKSAAPVTKKSSRSSDSKSVVSTSTQIGSKNSLKRTSEPSVSKVKRPSSKSGEAAVSGHQVSSSAGSKTKVMNDVSSASQVENKSTKSGSNSGALPRSRVSSALAGPAPGHRDKSKSGKK